MSIVNTSLWNITRERLAIMDELMENGGELTPDLELALEINTDNLIHKVPAYHAIIHQLEAQKEAAKAEQDRIKAYQDHISKAIDRLNYNLLQALLLLGNEDKKGIKRLEIGTLRLSTRKSESVHVSDVAALPITYQRVKTSVEPDKTAIKEVLKSGVEVPGCTLETKYSLVIK